MIQNRLNKIETIVLIVSAVVIITIVSACSPLYPLNVWDDVNVYFTVGRGVLEGLVPYRDLYEQKGPLFLFMYSLAGIISKSSFTGVWLFECIFASVFSIYLYKSVKLFIDNPPIYLIPLVPVLLSVVYTCGMFNFGGNTEEFSFALLSVVMYIALKNIKYRSLPNKKDSFLCGLITGFLFWTKYTSLGFIVSLVLLILFMGYRKRMFKTLGIISLVFVVGILTISTPVFIYFGVNSSLPFLFEAYFYNNIFNYISIGQYTGVYANPVIRFLLIPIVALFDTCHNNISFGLLLLLSVIGLFSIEKKYRKDILILFFVSFPMTLKFVFSQNFYTYYYGYILSFYFVFALILISNTIVYLSMKFKRIAKTLSVIICLFIFLGELMMCKNLYLLSVPKNELSQYVFSEIINEMEEPKVLTYDIIDGGFYLAAGITPSNRFFTTMNFIGNNEQAVQEQERLIEEGYFDYIVTYSDEYDWDNYELIMTDTDPYCDFTKELYLDQHCLYQRIP